MPFFRAAPTAYGSSQIRSELQLLAYTTATVTQDLSCVCDLHHSSRQHQIPDPLSKARDRTPILIDTSRIHFHCATTGTPQRNSFQLSVIPLSICEGRRSDSCEQHQEALWWLSALGKTGFYAETISSNSYNSGSSLWASDPWWTMNYFKWSCIHMHTKPSQEGKLANSCL